MKSSPASQAHSSQHRLHVACKGNTTLWYLALRGMVESAAAVSRARARGSPPPVCRSAAPASTPNSACDRRWASPAQRIPRTDQRQHSVSPPSTWPRCDVFRHKRTGCRERLPGSTTFGWEAGGLPMGQSSCARNKLPSIYQRHTILIFPASFKTHHRRGDGSWAPVTCASTRACPTAAISSSAALSAACSPSG